MKTLKDHIIIYDDECPMCDLYTRAFVKTKMLEENGREPFSWLSSTISKHLDKGRARNEIALVNSKNGNVLYGIDSLFEIVSHRFPFFKPLFYFTPFRLVMKTVYSFISYNRRVLVPTKKFEGKNSCTPDFNLTYRWAFIVFAWLVTSLILNSYSKLLTPLIPHNNFYWEFLICGGQIIVQSMTIFFLRRERIVHYLGNMMTISMVGAILLLPALVLSLTGLITSEFFYAAWFMMVVALMFLEHARRVKILGIHWTATFSWILYRMVILLAILWTK